VISAADLEGFLAVDGALHSYTQTTIVQVSQNVVCNTAHSTEQRAARWLLTTGDRVRSDGFALTQEFLGRCSACAGRRCPNRPAACRPTG
jgi:hypothetical protein